MTYTEFFSSWTFTSVLLLRYLDNSIGCCSPLRVLFSQSLHGKYGQSWQQWGRLNLSKEDLRTRQLGNHIWNPQLCWDCTWNMSQRMALLFLLLRTKKRCDRGLCEKLENIYNYESMYIKKMNNNEYNVSNNMERVEKKNFKEKEEKKSNVKEKREKVMSKRRRKKK